MKLFGDAAMPYFAEPQGPGWYVADAVGHDLFRVTFTTKRAAVRAIRLMTPARERPRSKPNRPVC